MGKFSTVAGTDVSDANADVGDVKSPKTFYSVAPPRKSGTLAESFTYYYDGNLAAGARYTPADAGIFCAGASQGGAHLTPNYYSTAKSTWYSPGNVTKFQAIMAIGDGTNFSMKNDESAQYRCTLLRHSVVGGTYSRYADAGLAAGTTYTPASAGFYAEAVENITVAIQQYANASWGAYNDIWTTANPLCIFLTDGTSIRVNNGGASNYQYVLMRAINL